jgi:hypothetical protein
VKLAEKLEADFYREPAASSNASPDHPEIKKPNGDPESWPISGKITGKMILEAIRLADADTKRELMRVLFA